MKCEMCGTEFFEGKFCPECGTKIIEKSPNFEYSEEKYSGKEMVDKIAKLITGGLSAVSLIMIIGAIFGVFDNNPIPFIVFVGIVMIVDKLDEKCQEYRMLFGRYLKL